MAAKLFGQLTDFACGCDQFNHFLAEFRRVRPSSLTHISLH